MEENKFDTASNQNEDMSCDLQEQSDIIEVNEIKMEGSETDQTNPECSCENPESTETAVEKTYMSSNRVRGFACPYKGEESFGTCQDSLYADPVNKFFSVVDGVSEGMGQFYFVHLLSRHNAADPDVSMTKEDLTELYGQWRAFQQKLIDEGRMNAVLRNMYEKGKIAHSTYIRLKFFDAQGEEPNMMWRCAVLGDSALIHVHRSGDNMEIKHVVMSTETIRAEKYIYSDSPEHYFAVFEAPDQTDEEGTWLENEARMQGICEKGDIFILATDHVSEWILADPTKSNERISLLLDQQTQDDFRKLMDRERDDNPVTKRPNMGDDDVTAMIIEIDDPSDNNFNVTAMIDPKEMYEIEKKKRQNNR